MEKAYKWLKDNWKNILLVCLLGAIVYLFVKPIQVKGIAPAKAEVAKVELKKVEPIKAECAPTVIENVIKADGILDTSKYVVLDLNTFKVVKTKEENGKTLTYYARYGAVDEWYTIGVRNNKEGN